MQCIAPAVCHVQQLERLGRTLVIGRRTNVLLGNDSLLYLPDNVPQTARQRGELFGTNAQDYFFIAFNDFPWHQVTDVVVGLPAYDNYLVSLAVQQSVAVVDATATLLAFHQTDADGNFAGHGRNESGFNAQRIGSGFKYHLGITTAAQYETKYVVNTSTVTVEKRHKLKNI